MFPGVVAEKRQAGSAAPSEASAAGRLIASAGRQAAGREGGETLKAPPQHIPVRAIPTASRLCRGAFCQTRKEFAMGTKVREVMTTRPRSVTPQTPLNE